MGGHRSQGGGTLPALQLGLVAGLNGQDFRVRAQRRRRAERSDGRLWRLAALHHVSGASRCGHDIQRRYSHQRRDRGCDGVVSHHQPERRQRRLRVEHGSVRQQRDTRRRHLDRRLQQGPGCGVRGDRQRTRSDRFEGHHVEARTKQRGRVPGGQLLRSRGGRDHHIPEQLPGRHHLPLHPQLPSDGGHGTRRRRRWPFRSGRYSPIRRGPRRAESGWRPAPGR